MRRITRSTPFTHVVPSTILLLAAGVPLARAAGTFDMTPTWTLEADQPGARLGTWVAPAGDVNGDGYDDVLVAEPFYSAGPSERGRVRLYYGSPDGLALSPGWSMEGETASLYFGVTTGSAGDVNGDGFDDLVIGMSRQVRVFLGSPDGPGTIADWSVAGDLPFDPGRGPIGFDANGDGFDDLIVTELDAYEPRLLLFRGYPQGLRPKAHDSIVFPPTEGYWSTTFAAAGDTDADGTKELVAGSVGLLEVPIGSPCCGRERVYLYEGGSRSFRDPGAPIHTASSYKVIVPLGLDGAGDVNGDGFDDLIVTEYNVDPNHHGIQPIHVLVLAGSPSGAMGPPAAVLDGFQIVDLFGESASRAGDFDGDGYADLLVGAPAYDDGETDEGAAFIYRGGPFASGP